MVGRYPSYRFRRNRNLHETLVVQVVRAELLVESRRRDVRLRNRPDDALRASRPTNVADATHQLLADARAPKRLRDVQVDHENEALPMVRIVAEVIQRVPDHTRVHLGHEPFKCAVFSEAVTQVLARAPVELRLVAQSAKVRLKFGREAPDCFGVFCSGWSNRHVHGWIGQASTVDCTAEHGANASSKLPP